MKNMKISNGADKKSPPKAYLSALGSDQPWAEKIFFSVFFLAVFIVVAASFYKFYVLKDYYVKLEAECDPAAEKCFVYECDPAVDAECPANAAERVSFYKFIEKKANLLPLCAPADANCPSMACQAGEDCREILCDETAKTEDESCNDPAEYLKNQVQDIPAAGNY